jgi:hypothetical protein
VLLVPIGELTDGTSLKFALTAISVYLREIQN